MKYGRTSEIEREEWRYGITKGVTVPIKTRIITQRNDLNRLLPGT